MMLLTVMPSVGCQWSALKPPWTVVLGVSPSTGSYLHQYQSVATGSYLHQSSGGRVTSRPCCQSVTFGVGGGLGEGELGEAGGASSEPMAATVPGQ